MQRPLQRNQKLVISWFELVTQAVIFFLPTFSFLEVECEDGNSAAFEEMEGIDGFKGGVKFQKVSCC